jgi:hypothetical protein
MVTDACTSALRRRRQKEEEFKGSLSYIEIPCFKNKWRPGTNGSYL